MRDLFLIGGAKTYKIFADVIDKWIVTEIPETVENADTFMLKDSNLSDPKELENKLSVKIYSRK